MQRHNIIAPEYTLDFPGYQRTFRLCLAVFIINHRIIDHVNKTFVDQYDRSIIRVLQDTRLLSRLVQDQRGDLHRIIAAPRIIHCIVRFSPRDLVLISHLSCPEPLSRFRQSTG